MPPLDGFDEPRDCRWRGHARRIPEGQRVETQLDVWKEMDQRLRHWAVLPEARRLLNDSALSRLAVKLQAQLRKAH